MTLQLALCKDADNNMYLIRGEAETFRSFATLIEDMGCIVIENQTDDYEDATVEEIEEDTLTLDEVRADKYFTPLP
jgi:hypothetical protein